ncbi:alpha/beta fold hydrolase [Nocardia speluncae]|uniref:Alpha/beta fold hydrolase n=1 Tax=Nocardia speluncae TaxID=419477 RepID=A0A846XCX9_9NOCA|nr:alpha/beta fold hydrolase [Nocardia speluncae]NKY32536.1 alpha/beta fold hydrolase [Nocardia speluncae]
MGDELPLVLVPGMLCDAQLWAELTPGPGVRLVHAAIDAPSVAGMADQVLTSTDGPFVLAGLSLGAIVGFEVLRRAPERVLGFCAISTNPHAPVAAQYRGWHDMAFRTLRGEFETVVRNTIAPTMFADRHRTAERIEQVVAMARRIGPDRFQNQLRAQADRIDSLPSLAAAGCPALIVSADEDALCPPDFHRAIADAVEGSRLETVAGAGHLCTWEVPHRISDLISDWLQVVATDRITRQESSCP